VLRSTARRLRAELIAEWEARHRRRSKNNAEIDQQKRKTRQERAEAEATAGEPIQRGDRVASGRASAGLDGPVEQRGGPVNGFEEHATDSRRLAAAESLARATGVEVAVAYRHLQNGTAKMLIESRCDRRARPTTPGQLGRWDR
jgi:hypothetical protein